ncbi:hypothetical protein R1flu_023166 [Riccia fluitans]|uniref:Uncharacterized protein n=1 Tax=Riccia fluitans TaxID=41844 RepID=A0ABD1XRR5_9MARC
MSHSPNLDKLDQEASMQNIDRLIEALEMEAKESRMFKCKKLFSDEASNSALQGHPDDYALDKQVRMVINQVLRIVGKANRSFCLTTLLLFVVAHVDPRIADYRLDWHMWISSEIRGRLGHDRKDKFSGGKFREGWQAIVRIVTADFLAKQATARHEPLLLKARNAFTNTRAEWDNEKGELVGEREALKEELNKAKEMAVEAKQCSEAVRLEKEALKQRYTREKVRLEDSRLPNLGL